MQDAIISLADVMEGAAVEAEQRIGIKETPRTPNEGPEINLFLAAVGLAPGVSWCAAFVHFCYRVAAAKLSTVNPCPRTGGCLKMWALADAHWKTQAARRGSIYVLDHGSGKGHVGIVTEADAAGAVVAEISGNTNREGSREGNQVAVHHGPPELSHKGKLIGFIDFAREPLPLVA